MQSPTRLENRPGVGKRICFPSELFGLPGAFPAARSIPELWNAVRKISRAAGKAGISARNLDAIYLVGGSSKLPLVWKMMAERFKNVRIVIYS